MGEIADMMIEGLLCETCGVYIDSPADGYPRRCRGCADDAGVYTPLRSTKVACPKCGRKVKPAGLADHQRDKHAALGEEGR